MQKSLGHVAGRSYLQGAEGDLLAALGGHENDRHAAILLADGGNQLQAVDRAHLQVGQHKIRRLSLDALQGLFAAGGIIDDKIRLSLEDFAGHHAIDGAVVNNQHSRHGDTSWV